MPQSQSFSELSYHERLDEIVHGRCNAFTMLLQQTLSDKDREAISRALRSTGFGKPKFLEDGNVTVCCAKRIKPKK